MTPATLALFFAAAVLEIAGCFAVWAWLRGAASAVWLVPGLVCLAAFAGLLAFADGAVAGRAFAAYGGIYIVTSLGWMLIAEGVRPGLSDLAGAALCLVGAAVILAAPRT